MTNTGLGFQLPDNTQPFDPDVFISFLASEGNRDGETITPDLWNDALKKAAKAAEGRPNLWRLSHAELDELIERLTNEGAPERDTPEWTAAYTEWERRQEA